ncbi:hypothetical protein HX120_03995 [Acinetobacter indicus]|nr:hypothetical protein [Acinetobacter indicus]
MTVPMLACHYKIIGAVLGLKNYFFRFSGLLFFYVTGAKSGKKARTEM